MPGWLIRLLVAMLISQTAVFVVRPVLTYRALDLGAGDREVGLLVAVYALLPALVALPIGRYCDRRRPGPVFQAGMLLLIVGCVGLSFAPTLVLVAVATLVLGVGALAVMIGAQSLVARLSDEVDLDRDFGLISAAASLGQMIGPSIGGLVLAADVARSITTTRAFAIGAIICVIALAACWRFGDTSPPRIPGLPKQETHGWIGILRLPKVMGGMFASLALLSTVDLLVAYLPVLGEQRGISPAIIGLLLSLRAAASVASRLLIPALLLRWGRPGLLLASTLASGVLIALLPLAGSVWLMGLLLAFAGFFLGIGQPLTMSLVVQAVPVKARGAALSLRIMANKAGQVGMAAAIALVTGVVGVGGAFVILGGVLLSSSIGVIPSRAARRKE